MSINEICEKYGFETRQSGINDDFFTDIYTKNTDGKEKLWFDIQHVKHGEKIEPILTIYGNTDQMNLWLCETRKDLSLEDAIDFRKEIAAACNCKLVTHYTEDKNELNIHSLIDLEDLQEMPSKQYDPSNEDIRDYVDKYLSSLENQKEVEIAVKEINDNLEKIKLQEDVNYEVYTSCENYPDILKEINQEDRVKGLMMLYMSNPTLDELQSWDLDKIKNYIQETDELYETYKETYSKCFDLISPEKEMEM